MPVWILIGRSNGDCISDQSGHIYIFIVVVFLCLKSDNVQHKNNIMSFNVSHSQIINISTKKKTKENSKRPACLHSFVYYNISTTTKVGVENNKSRCRDPQEMSRSTRLSGCLFTVMVHGDTRWQLSPVTTHRMNVWGINQSSRYDVWRCQDDVVGCGPSA